MFSRVFNEGIETPRSSREMVSTVTSISSASSDCVSPRSFPILAIWVPINYSTFSDISMTPFEVLKNKLKLDGRRSAYIKALVKFL